MNKKEPHRKRKVARNVADRESKKRQGPQAGTNLTTSRSQKKATGTRSQQIRKTA